MKAQTREEWLMNFTEALRPHFKDAGFPLPKKIRIGCGWPSRRALGGGKMRSLGEHWHPDASKDGSHNIVISIYQDKSADVAGTLVHELAHAATPGAGHKGKFVQCIRNVGLLGKPKEAGKLGSKLKERLNAHVKKVGKYPHGSVDGSTKKKQGTRMIKLICHSCGYTVRTTMKWIEVGIPTCCCGQIFFSEDLLKGIKEIQGEEE